MKNKIELLIKRGEDLLNRAKNIPGVYQVKCPTDEAIKSLNDEYKDWRNGYDEVVEDLKSHGYGEPFSNVSADDEQSIIFLNVRDINEKWRKLVNVIQKHVEELIEISTSVK